MCVVVSALLAHKNMFYIKLKLTEVCHEYIPVVHGLRLVDLVAVTDVSVRHVSLVT
jgi:hypothetical protein